MHDARTHTIVLHALAQASEDADQAGWARMASLRQHMGEALPPRTLRRWLAAWVEQGVLERRGQGAGSRYRLAKAMQKPEPAAQLAFLRGLDDDLRQALVAQIRDLWSHHSTALEGNTLSLGDTHFLLTEGLTVSGHSLREHDEVHGHGQAVALLYRALDAPLTQAWLFALHRAVQRGASFDALRPVGAWKLEANGTYMPGPEGHACYVEYAAPLSVPALMAAFMAALDDRQGAKVTWHNAHAVYARLHMGFVHIHPFADGNGRMARLIANLPLLRAGLPPLLIPKEARRAYLEMLAHYQRAVGQLSMKTGVWPEPARLRPFATWCKTYYATTRTLVEQAQAQQRRRQCSGRT